MAVVVCVVWAGDLRRDQALQCSQQPAVNSPREFARYVKGRSFSVGGRAVDVHGEAGASSTLGAEGPALCSEDMQPERRQIAQVLHPSWPAVELRPAAFRLVR